MTTRAFVENNYAKKRNHFAAKIYPTLCYGDLDRELDFPSCEISFCSPAGQPHHFAYTPTEGSRRCTRMQSVPVPLRELALHLQHLAWRYTLLSAALAHCKLRKSLHWLCISPNVERWHPEPCARGATFWPVVIGRETSHVYENGSDMHLAGPRNVKHHTPEALFIFSEWNQRHLDERASLSLSLSISSQMESEYTDGECVPPFNCNLCNARGEAAASPPLSCGRARRWDTFFLCCWRSAASCWT